MGSASLRRSVDELGTAISSASRRPNRVEISHAAVDVARQSDIPKDVREELVESVRDQIESGAYDSNERLDSALSALFAELADDSSDSLEVNRAQLLAFLAKHPDTPVLRISLQFPDSPAVGDQVSEAVEAFFEFAIGEPFHCLAVEVRPDTPPGSVTHGSEDREQ